MNNIFINIIYNKKYYYINRENVLYYTSIYNVISNIDLYNQDYQNIVSEANKCDGLKISLYGFVIFDFDRKIIFNFQYFYKIDKIAETNFNILNLNDNNLNIGGNNIENVKYILSIYDVDNYIGLKKFILNFFYSKFRDADDMIDDIIRNHKLRVIENII